jgi:tetratricopeptide (TPR) repeat protein
MPTSNDSPNALATPASPKAAQALEAMRRGYFKDAIKLFKQLVKEEGPRWLGELAQAYAARARELAAKGMYEDAQILLDNTTAQDGTVRDPLLYVHCLLKRGQHQKAAEHALKYVGTGKLSAPEAARLGEAAAALSLATPCRLDTAVDPHSERGKWLGQAAAARQALAAWLEGKPREDIDPLLNRISMRSDFRAVRLILKALITAPLDADRARQLMEPVSPQSPFAALRFAVEAALAAPASDPVRNVLAPSGPERSFLLEVNGLSESGCQALAQFVKAESSGPGSLFSHLIRQIGTECTDDIRQACLSLLPQVPDRLSRFEKSFGPLSAFDKARVLALAGEAKEDWDAADWHWRAAAASLEANGDAGANLALGVIYRHLARLAGADLDFDAELDEVAVDYLDKGHRFDPDHLPTALKLIAHYRTKDRLDDWGRLVETVLARFPDEAAVLLAAVEWAAHAADLDRAIELAHKLLLRDPINAAVRKRLIELHLLLARKKMYANRPDLAQQVVDEALKLEQPEAPSFPLRIAAALIALSRSGSSAAVAQLREAVDLAGGDVCAWVQASLEHLLMGGAGDGSVLRRELKAAQKAPPTKEAILFIAAAVDGDGAREHVSVASLIRGMRRWLLKGATLPWSAEEVRPVAAMLWQADAYKELGAYAKQGLARNRSEGIWHCYRLIAETKGNVAVLCGDDAEELAEIADDAAHNGRLHDAKLIWRFLDSADDREATTDADDDRYLDELVSKFFFASLQRISPEEVARLIAKHGAAKATKLVAGKLQGSPVGAIVPPEKLSELAQGMVAEVMAQNARQPQAREERPWQQR